MKGHQWSLIGNGHIMYLVKKMATADYLPTVELFRAAGLDPGQPGGMRRSDCCRVGIDSRALAVAVYNVMSRRMTGSWVLAAIC